MKSFFIILSGIFVSMPSFSQARNTNIATWKVYPIPTNADTLHKYNWSKMEWHVGKKGKQVYAMLVKDIPANRLPFEIKPLTPIEKIDFAGQISFVEVDDGYLVSFNQGEFGGHLYWFDKKGENRKSIGRALITEFIKRDNRIFVIAGLAHMGMSLGGITELRRENENWKMVNFVDLHDAPFAVNLDKENNFVVVTLQHLLSVDMSKKIDTLIKEGFWDLLYPNSLVIDKGNIYVGMRQGILKFDAARRKEEWLMPE